MLSLADNTLHRVLTLLKKRAMFSDELNAAALREGGLCLRRDTTVAVFLVELRNLGLLKNQTDGRFVLTSYGCRVLKELGQDRQQTELVCVDHNSCVLLG